MLRRIALILVGTVLAALVAELALRAIGTIPDIDNPLHSFHESDAILGWRGKSGVRMRFRRTDFDALVEHGPDGWRRPDPPRPPHPTRRVLFLGDSFTWGWGVGQGEVFTDRLQQRLPPSVAVYNRGVTAFGTAQEYLLLQRELAERQYDAVAVMFFQNDVHDDVNGKHGRRPLFKLNGDGLAPRNQPPRRLMSPVRRLFKDHSRAFQLVDFELNQLKVRLRGEWREPAFREGETDVDYHGLPGAAVTMRLLAEMHRLAAGHGAQLVLVYLPHRSEIDGAVSPYPYIRAVHAMIGDVAAREQIPLVDLSGPFREQARQGRALTFPQDDHWNPSGHELAAETLLASPLFN
jgi:lysophospholipase L1-like esterase